MKCESSIDGIVAAEEAFGIEWTWKGKQTGAIQPYDAPSAQKSFVLRGVSCGTVEDEVSCPVRPFFTSNSSAGQLRSASLLR
jgi:hypothetical protein